MTFFSEQLEINQWLKQSPTLAIELFHFLFSKSNQGIFIADQFKKVLYVNNALPEMCGVTQESILGKSFTVLHDNSQEAGFWEQVWLQLHQDKIWSGEIWQRHETGQPFPLYVVIHELIDPVSKQLYFLGLLSDITTAVKSGNHQQLELIHYDPLTSQIHNRRLLNEQLDKTIQILNRYFYNPKQSSSLKPKTRLAVFFIDLDKFKLINDQYGHHIGDLVLIEFSKRLKNAIRRSDLLARYGGDEFVLVSVIKHGKADAIKICERILEGTSQPYTIKSHSFQLTASIGVSFYPSDAISPENLLHAADRAMYYAKNVKHLHHRNYIFYEEVPSIPIAL